ncbi:MAG: hypothetical protein AAGF84_11465 [Planctomycetota bacterium]
MTKSLDALLDPVAPDFKKWASVIIVDGPDETPTFTWHHYRDSEHSIDFWPASVVKLYTCVAGCEKLNAMGLPTDVRLDFLRPDPRKVYADHPQHPGYRVEACRMFPEMCSGIFRESTNDDYTMQLRFYGIDAINTDFFTAANGFTHTALMRGYVHLPPHVYERELPQRIEVTDPVTGESQLVEHTWSGTSYSEKLGAHVLSKTTANCSTTRDMAECLRRVMFHEVIPEAERFDLRPDQLKLLREGRDGYTGLKNTEYAWGWDDAVEAVMPEAEYFHKPGNISNYYVELAYVRDAASGTRFVMAVATESRDKNPCRDCCKAIAAWAKK